MVAFITFTTLTHALLYFIDEHVIHRKRGLAPNEIKSGIFDGILYVITVGLTIFTSYTETLGVIYFILATLSCLSIIKHEYFYPEVLEKRERIIHALLYVFHPLILFAFFESWKSNLFDNHLHYWILQLCYFALAFKGATFYIIYWNYIYEKEPRKTIKID